MEESDLIHQLKEGDKAALKILFENFKSRVFNTCLSYLQHTEEAEEITQDVFLEIHRSIGNYKGESTLSTWIYRISVNKCLDFLRHRKRKKRAGILVSIFKKDSTELQVDSPHFDHPGVALENKEKAALLFKVIDKLPDQQKTAFILSQIEDLPQKEIATIMKLSEKAIESLLQRAKANLRKDLEVFNPGRRKSVITSSKLKEL
jgi:RNA polymerase sigma factor (sigma-70 family)